jgi:two-component sensor histidine kinase
MRLQAAKIARQAEAPTHDAVQLLLLRFDAEISAVARLHRQLSAGKWRAPADVADELREVCAPFRSGLSGAATVIEDFERGCTVTPDQILPLTQIVTEVITNALKHAYAGERNGVIRVNLRKAGDGAAVVEIVDQGWGFPVGFNPVTDGGLGFRVVRALAEQLHAAVAFDSSGEGVRFRLTLPPPA